MEKKSLKNFTTKFVFRRSTWTLNDRIVRVADFGLCKKVHENPGVTFCGTPEYMAPEILLEKPYGTAVDWWALGVMMFYLLSGRSPYPLDLEDEEELFEIVETGDYKFDFSKRKLDAENFKLSK